MRKYFVLTATISALLLALISTPANASVPANGTYPCSTGSFSINNGVVSAGASCAGDVVIPAGVTRIGQDAFDGATSLTSITIPDSVTQIRVNAFNHATSLASITFEGTSTLASIGDNAFNDATALTSITIPASVTSIGDVAFDGATSLTSITFEGTSEGTSALTSIGDYAFEDAAAPITVPASVTSIGNLAFSNATSITVANGNPNYSSLDDVLFNLGKTSLIQYPSGKSQTSYSIPASVTSIGLNAFRETSLTSITIPASVTSLGAGAFYNATALTSITIPASVTSIGTIAFFNTTSLTSITVANENPNYSSLDDVLFNLGKTSLIQYPIGKSQTSYSIPASVTSIGVNAFRNATALTSITIPASVTSIESLYGANAFNGATALASVYFLGDAPTADAFTSVASGAKAYIKTGATGFAAIGSVWKNLTVAFVVYSVTYDSNGGSAVASGSFLQDGAISQAPTQPTRLGFTFVGWSATDGGSTVTFPYTPTSNSDLTLYAQWTAEAAPAPAPAPAYRGPVIDSALTVQAGSEVTFTGKRLDSVTSAFVGGVQLPVVLAESKSLVLEVASSLPHGTYDLVIRSSFGSLTFHQGITVLASSNEESEIEPALDRKLSVGSFKGFIAIYTKGYDGQRLSAKVAGKWLVVESLDESFQGKNYSRTLRRTGSGQSIKVHLYIDSEFLRTDELTTK